MALQLSNKKYYGSVNIIAPISLIDEKQKRVIALSISGRENTEILKILSSKLFLPQ